MFLSIRSILFTFFTLLHIVLIDCSKTGAPLEACADLKPGHNVTNGFQTTKNPCSVKYEKLVNGTYRFTLKSDGFKGFALAVKDGSKYVGTWTENVNARILECPQGKVITHTINDVKYQVDLFWMPNGAKVENLELFGTCVRDYKNFWRIKQNFP
ncbi:putative defense protein 2 [Brevipalpus obovatus]|uniref:putative defense protein 2 n=1 Tax=Brevipalpus obovatus TaxID=246614 RepID=UPI003D9F2965